MCLRKGKGVSKGFKSVSEIGLDVVSVLFV